ncbi:ABC transporter permease subunit [Halobacterium sp. MBLA0001]|uniref:ABC transporter permease subunit n=1 Tax=Halobacterium sp. MBLA0001 TaxID=3413511 RepID=UPI003C71B547
MDRSDDTKLEPTRSRFVSSRLPLASRQFRVKLQNPRYWLYCLFVFGFGTARMNGLIFAQTSNYTPGPEHPILVFQWVMGIIGGSAAIFLGYNIVAGDRASGRIRLLLKLPYTRSRYIAEKFLGEAAALVTFTTIAILGGFAVWTVVNSRPPLLASVVFLGFTALYLLVWLSLSTAVSAVVKTGRRSVSVLVSLFFGMLFFWEGIMGPPIQANALFFDRLVPIRSYLAVTNWIAGLPNTHSWGTSVMEQLKVTNLFVTNVTIVPRVLDGAVPWYLSEWLSLVVLSLWGIVPLLIACRWFNTTDIA